jgi:hypothetical protein
VIEPAATRPVEGAAAGPDAAAVVMETVERLALDLRELTILTEAATGPFAVTAAIAGAAGAERVLAVARDSAYGPATAAERDTRLVARACGVERALQVVPEVDAAIARASDVITNLGFVRPIDARMAAWMKPTAVVALMCEAWEYRVADVDVGACRSRGILVLGTNERVPPLPVFEYCGPLALSLLSDAGRPVSGSRVAVLGRDAFTPVIAAALAGAGAHVRSDQRLTPESIAAAIAGVQTIVVAEYGSADVVLGDGGLVPAAEAARLAPGASIVQFAGALEWCSLVRHGVAVWPAPPVEARRMSRTLGHLGVRPVIELHAAGLKVAEYGARARRRGLPADAAADDAVRRSPLVQAVAPRA